MAICLSKYYLYLFNLNQKSLNGIWQKTTINIDNLIYHNTSIPKKIPFNYTIPRMIRNGDFRFYQVKNEMKLMLMKNYNNDLELSNFIFDIAAGIIDHIFTSGKVKESDIFILPIQVIKKIMEYHPIKYVNLINHMRNVISDKSRLVLSTCLIKCYDFIFFDQKIIDLLKDNIKKRVIHVVGCPIVVLIYKDLIFDKFQIIKYSEYSKKKICNQTFEKYNINQILVSQNLPVI